MNKWNFLSNDKRAIIKKEYPELDEVTLIKNSWNESNNIKELDTGHIKDASIDVINTVMFVRTVAVKTAQGLYYGSKKLTTHVINLFKSRQVVKTIVKNDKKLDKIATNYLTDGERKGFVGIRGKIELNTPKGMGRNKDAIINGRKYWGHELDRMQDRGIPLSVVENCIKNGKKVQSTRKTSRWEYHDFVNNVKVVTEKDTGEVVSVMFGARK